MIKARLSGQIGKITYQDMLKTSDLIAIVEITPDIVTYKEPFIHTLYKAKVIQIVKGSAPEFVYIYQLEGYHPEY